MSPQENITLFEVEPDEAATQNKIRTKAGSLSSTTLKAIKWYSIEHELRLVASSALPYVSFLDRSGVECLAHIDDVVQGYDNFKKAAHGKRSA